MDADKTQEELEKELGEMQLEFLELERCHIEFQNIRKRYEHLLQSAPDAMIFVNREAKIMRINAQFGNLFGYTEEELLGKDLHLLIPERYRSRHRNFIVRYFDQPRARPMGGDIMISGLKKDGSEFPADISISPLLTDDELFTVAAVRDITERKKAEEERQRLRDQLAQTEKISALGRIAATVADEIRNPLTSVGGFARRLQKIADTEKEREYAEFITSEVGKIESLLRAIFAFSHTRSPLLEDHDIQGIIDETLKPWEKRIRQQTIAVNKSYQEAAVVRVDKTQVQEAIDPIIANAVEAMPDGGSLSIYTDQEIIKGASYIRVVIRDTGSGIPFEKIGRIFEPFFTTKVLSKGAGLGLSIAKKIIEEEGGMIRIDSAEGSGTAVTLLFPAVGTAYP